MTFSALVTQGPADLAVMKRVTLLEPVPASNPPRTRIRFEVVATNNGPDPAFNIRLVESPPMTLDRVTCSPNSGRDIWECRAPTLAVGESVTLVAEIDAAPMSRMAL